MILKTRHIKDTKNLLGAKPTFRISTPKLLYLPVTNTRCNKAEVYVKAGDKVLLNQVIGMRHAAFFDQPIHATCSGTVLGVEKHYHRSGKLMDFIKIENDGLDTKDPSSHQRTEEEVMALSHEEATEIIKNCACVGLGGSSFPTYIKFQTKNPIHTILVNAIECEPYISADHSIALQKTQEILEGIRYIMHIFNVSDARICIKHKYHDIDEAYRDILKLPQYKGITIQKLGNYFPQGWEIEMIKNATGINVERGHLPSEYGILNFNISTVWGIYRALKLNEPVYRRLVSITGEGVRVPANFLVRVGTPITQLISACGGYQDEDKPKDIVLGGPMMGACLPSDDCIVTKTVTSVLVFNHVDYKELPCIRCGSCIASCPSGLNPIEITRTMRTMPVDKKKIKELMPSKCISCGLCTYSCTSRIDLRANVERAKVIERLP